MCSATSREGHKGPSWAARSGALAHVAKPHTGKSIFYNKEKAGGKMRVFTFGCQSSDIFDKSLSGPPSAPAALTISLPIQVCAVSLHSTRLTRASFLSGL